LLIVLSLVSFLILSACSLTRTTQEVDAEHAASVPSLASSNYEQNVDGSWNFFTNKSAMLTPSGSTFWLMSDPVNSLGGATSWTYEVGCTKVSGNQSMGFGIIFAGKDLSNYLCVLLQLDGNYRVMKVTSKVAGDVNGWVGDWVSNSKIYKGFGMNNIIKIKHTPSNEKPYEVFINNEISASFSFKEDDYNTGKRVGFITVLSSGESFPSVPVSVKYSATIPSTGLVFTN